MLKGLFVRDKEKKNIAMPALEDVNLNNIPQHVAIIMDGNGRWAKAQNKPRTFGHNAGAQTLKTIVRFADSLGVKILSAYAFSTENWKRPITEVNFIMELLQRYLTLEIQEFKDNNVQVRFMGTKEGLPPAIVKQMEATEAETKDNTGIILNLAVNYGGRAEIMQAVQSIAAEVEQGRLSSTAITDELFEQHLYTRGLPAPDLLIRPGGDQRISNFMLWQVAYAEIWTTPTYWPDFTQEMFLEAIKNYQQRDRRYGGLNK